MANIYGQRVHNGSILSELFNGIVQQFSKIICSNTNKIIDFQTEKYSSLANQIAQISKKLQTKAIGLCEKCDCRTISHKNYVNENRGKRKLQLQQSQQLSELSNYTLYENEYKNSSLLKLDIFQQKLSMRSAQEQDEMDKHCGTLIVKQLSLNKVTQQTDEQTLLIEKLEGSNILSLPSRKKQFSTLSKKFLNMKFCPTFSKLLFKFPGQNKAVNLLQTFGNKKNILLVASLTNDNIITAFSSLEFSNKSYPKNLQQQQFFIANLNNNIFIEPKPENKGIKEKSNHLIFGNQQLILNHITNTLKVNFIKQGYYKYPQKIPIEQLKNEFLGNQRDAEEAQIKQYEIYQLFQKKQPIQQT